MLEPYNPLFGEPPTEPPKQRSDVALSFKLKNNRIQFPSVILDIDALDLEHLPPHIRYYGQFRNNPYTDDQLVVFRYYDKLLLHARDLYGDIQMVFLWETIDWITDLFERMQGTQGDFLNLFKHTHTIRGHEMALISILGDKPGTEGFWLRDYDAVCPTALAYGGTDKRDIFVEAYFSNYGLFTQGGIAILRKAAQDKMPLIEEKSS